MFWVLISNLSRPAGRLVGWFAHGHFNMIWQNDVSGYYCILEQNKGEKNRIVSKFSKMFRNMNGKCGAVSFRNSCKSPISLHTHANWRKFNTYDRLEIAICFFVLCLFSVVGFYYHKAKTETEPKRNILNKNKIYSAIVNANHTLTRIQHYGRIDYLASQLIIYSIVK